MVIRRINIDILRYLAPMNQGRHRHHHHQHCNLRLSWASLGPVFIGCGSQFYKFVGQSRYALMLVLDHFRKCGNCMHSSREDTCHSVKLGWSELRILCNDGTRVLLEFRCLFYSRAGIRLSRPWFATKVTISWVMAGSHPKLFPLKKNIYIIL